jgi:hypothetical protein
LEFSSGKCGRRRLALYLKQRVHGQQACMALDQSVWPRLQLAEALLEQEGVSAQRV